MPKPQVPDVRCKVKGCRCVAVFHDVCGPIPSLNFRSLKDMFFGFIILEKLRFGKSTTLLQPFLSGKAFVQQCLEVKLFVKPLTASFDQMRLGSDRLLSGMLICFSEKIREEA